MDNEIEAETDITAFLKKACAQKENDLSQLHQHSFVVELFKKFNAICTSSAPVERLFSFAGNYNMKIVKSEFLRIQTHFSFFWLFPMQV